MKKQQIIRAWRDQKFYQSLSPAERAKIPANPVGSMVIDDETLNGISGGCGCGGGGGIVPGTGTFTCECTPGYC